MINAPDIELRLQKRFKKLVKQHMSTAKGVAAGLRIPPQAEASTAASLAAYRFYNNQRIDLVTTFEPILSQLKATVSQCKQWAIVLHDWSPLHYGGHKSKKDRVVLCAKNDFGYMLQAAILVSDRDGAPLQPLYLGVEASDGVHSTRRESVLPRRSQMDELNRTMGYIESLEIDKQIVHIIDREADSRVHLRRFERCERKFIIRGNDLRTVEYEGTSCLLREVEEKLKENFRFSREVEYKGKKAKQYVAETVVTLKEPGRQKRRREGRLAYKTIPGKAICLRLILAQVRDKDGTILATWRLWTNLPKSVSAGKVALWYYWRWRIESYFKLLKRAGQHAEQWQQESAQTIAKRLTVAAQACVIVWALMGSKDKQAMPLRRLLIRLSGRLMKRDVEWTAPALLAGTWQLLAIIDALDQYPLAHLREMGDLLHQMLGLDT